ncbi:MAG: phosphatidate cytidylyltransferase [Planctomycetes bacterium]|nr:phosphatidate cytidylyltransferase [Planctomycetota bacterium]
MLTTRLWMGGILIALTVGMLVGDQHLAPWFPFLFVFQLGLMLTACFEFIDVLGPNRTPQQGLSYLGVVVFVLANWLVHYPTPRAQPWTILMGIQAGFLLLAFLYEMAGFFGPGRSVERIALAWLIVGYLGFLPCFFAQIRWLTPDHQANSVRLALAVFVPKCCDIGAYAVGRLIGTHRMTPILSPKKTWEGAAGGLLAAVLAANLIDTLGPVSVLHGWHIWFGLTVGIAGMFGDLAESLIKRDCQTKDASAVMPGYGGVLDVVDAIIFAAPVAYLWFCLV